MKRLLCFVALALALTGSALAHNADNDMICILSGVTGSAASVVSFANNTIFLDHGEPKGTYVETSRGDTRSPRPVWTWEAVAGPRMILKDLAHPGVSIELTTTSKAPDALGISYMPTIAIRGGVTVARGECGAPIFMGEVVETSSTADQGKNP
jgi:hypothetical protein